MFLNTHLNYLMNGCILLNLTVNLEMIKVSFKCLNISKCSMLHKVVIVASTFGSVKFLVLNRSLHLGINFKLLKY